MRALSPEEIVDFVTPFMERAGLPRPRVEVVPEGEGELSSLPVANVFVEMGDLHAFRVHQMMVEAAHDMSDHLGTRIRSGYYSADLGFEDVAAPGEAMLQFDQFPFELDVELNLGPAPRM